MTVKYDTNNALALSIIHMMLQTGVFDIQFSNDDVDAVRAGEDDCSDSEEAEKEAFLYTSRINASKIFSKYL